MKFDFNVIWSIVAGLVICIPVVVKLVNVTKEAIRNKNWYYIVKAVSELMQDAEQLILHGADKKKYVLSMLESLVAQIDYQITDSDWQRISEMIDELATMSKIVNSGTSIQQTETEIKE